MEINLHLLDKDGKSVLDKKMPISELSDISIINYQGKSYMFGSWPSKGFDHIYFREISGTLDLK